MITLEEALKLVEFVKSSSGEWQIKNIHGDVYGDLYGDVYGDVWGRVYGDGKRDETPKEKLPADD